MAASIIVIPNATFIVEIITFIVMLLALAKWAYPPLIAAAERRQKDIEEQLAAAERLRNDAAKSLEDAKKSVDEAKQTAQTILDRARKEADLETREAHERSRAEADRLKKAAADEIARERQRAYDEARRDVASLVVDVSRRVLPKSIDLAGQQSLIDSTIEVVRAERPSLTTE
ncbi:MAG: F0F1 ATP synthase subunit B [Candidatus Dormibacteria bacterium]